MLLSMFTSFLLARRFRMKIFLPLIAAVIMFISYFSVGLPIRALTGSDFSTPSTYPLPLSFPFHSVNKIDRLYYESYEIYFLNYRIIEYWSHGYPGFGVYYHLSFAYHFLLFNVAGAILGYELSRAKSTWRYFARRKPETETTWKKIRGILLALVILLSSSFGIFSVLWSCQCIEVKARIIKKEFWVVLSKRPPCFFYLDNGERLRVSYDDYTEYQEGDLFTYRKSLSEIHTPRYDSEFSLRNMSLIGIVTLIVLTIFLGLSCITTEIRNKEEKRKGDDYVD